MDYYFLIITAVDIFVLGTMCVLTKYNETLDKRQRRWFIMSFVLIIVISVFFIVHNNVIFSDKSNSKM